MENKYKVGETVYAKSAPLQKFVVRRYVTRIYYCQDPEKKDGKDVVFFERELTNQAPIK